MNEQNHVGGRVDLGSRGKSEVITIRINPKMKFGLELMARLHNRSVAQTVEMAIQRVLSDPFDGVQQLRDVRYVPDIVGAIWSPHRGERLLNLVLKYPELLSYEEEVVWNKLIRSGRVDGFFKCASLPSVTIASDADRKRLESCIAEFWDEIDALEQEEAKKKRKAKKDE